MFGKAKIQRFNDVKVDGCPVALVKTNGHPKAKCLINEEKKSSECSVKTTFKTPASIKKKPCLTPKLKVKETKSENLKELGELIENLKVLEQQNRNLIQDNAKYEESIFELNSNYMRQLKNLQCNYESELNRMRARESRSSEEIKNLMQQYERFKTENLFDIQNLKSDIVKLELITKDLIQESNCLLEANAVELKEKEIELKLVKEKCEEIENKYKNEIDLIKREHQTEIHDIEYEMLKLVTELQKERENASNRIREIEIKFNVELERVKQCFDMEKQHILQMKEHCLQNEVVKDAIRSIELEWREKLQNQQKEAEEILKECQAISEYSIIQCEVEKNKIKEDFEGKCRELQILHEKYRETLRKYDEIRCRYRNLEINLSEIILELNDSRRDYAGEIKTKNETITKLLKEKTRFEFTLKNLQATVDVLTKRLINSDNDVEQLKTELTKNEETLLKYEQKCLQLISDLKQAQTYNDELEMQYESTIKLNRCEIDKIQADLCKRVDEYKNNIKSLNENLQKERELNNEIMFQLHSAHQIIDKLKIELECFEALNSQYEFEIEQSQNELEDYHMREMDWNIIKDKFEEHIFELEKKLQSQCDDLEKLKSELKSIKEGERCEKDEEENIFKKYIKMSGKYDDLLQKFEKVEQERGKKEQEVLELLKENEMVKNERKENEIVLTNKVKQLENELKDVSQKYADLIDSQNVIHKNDAQMKMIEKLKKENLELKKYLKKSKYDVENKENISSPNKSLNNSKVESSFRDRN